MATPVTLTTVSGDSVRLTRTDLKRYASQVSAGKASLRSLDRDILGDNKSGGKRFARLLTREGISY